MKKIKILVPLDSTQRSMHSLNWLKKVFSKDVISITIMNVMEMVITNNTVDPIQNEFDNLGEQSKLYLDKAIKELDGYEVEKFTSWGYAGDEILKKTQKDSYDIVIMTKSSKKGLYRLIGSVTSKVVRNAQVAVIVIPD
ncbi:universal stress protein [Clostridium psychrophilum]|uniref:universal stress protein n=1 Tax=Clostridium psychrophilum TaxID=132926 RepID=UPI001C0E66A6|nr:universal stress protein [Clostridium psychrophilum]MBU3182288.1 universal stress protein [Clostridium psychrophilum]